LAAKIWKERAENKRLVFHIILYFQSFADSTASLIFLSFVPLPAQGKRHPK